MSDDNIDYGPLTELIGTWKGNKGTDIAPDPDGIENNPYYETITFEPIGDVTNAESQTLVGLHYRQIVTRKSDNEVFHDQTGYWMWDSATGVISQSLNIPRVVSLLAGGTQNNERDTNGNIIIEVSASIDSPDWQIIQSPFMQKNACTKSFKHSITVGNGKLSYAETTMVDIYDKVFEHTDENSLELQ